MVSGPGAGLVAHIAAEDSIGGVRVGSAGDTADATRVFPTASPATPPNTPSYELSLAAAREPG